MNLRTVVAVPFLAAVTACAPVLPHPWPREAVCEAMLPASVKVRADAPQVDVPRPQAPNLRAGAGGLPSAPRLPTAPKADAAGGVAQQARPEVDSRFPQPDPEFWLSLILRGYDPSMRRATSPAIDCSGAQVRWEAPALLCVDPSTARAMLPDRPLGDGDVVVSEVDANHRLVWIMTSRYASGDALGPVALVERRGPWVVVEALGALRANPQSARLGLVQAGGVSVLVAEGESCTGNDVASCERSARIMPLVGNRFEASRIVNDAGACLGAGWLHLTREELDRMSPNRERRYRLDASIGAGPEGLKLVELVTVQDRDPRQPSAPERLFRRAEGTTVFRVHGADMVGGGSTLWARLLAARE